MLLEVSACGVCRTDLHVLDGELPGARYPVMPGHEIVGRVARGRRPRRAVQSRRTPRRTVARLHLRRTAAYCKLGLENLCERAGFTGYTLDGGYAEHAIADARYCFRIPDRYDDAHAAPLLCAGLIGYRAYQAAGDGRNLGLYGFGAAAHLLAQIARAQGREVLRVHAPRRRRCAAFARQLGAVWAGDSESVPPEALDAAIMFAPVGALVPAALAAIAQGRPRGLRRHPHERHPGFPYSLLWGERSCARSRTSREQTGASSWR